jgi:hypothetical protein
VSWRDRYEKRERFPGHPEAGVEYRLGPKATMGQREVTVEVRPSFGEPGLWDIGVHGPGSFTIQNIRDLDKALRVGLYLRDELEPEVVAENARREQWRRDDDERRRVKDEEERPAREAAARAREKALAEAEPEDAAKCPECEYVGDPEDFDEPLYECSTDGATARGYEDGRICDQCHKFRAKVSDTSCPECEAAVEPVTVQAKRIDNELVEVTDPSA